MIVPRYFEDLSVLHENTLPVRSYYVPTSGESDLPGDRPFRESSGRLRMLSGCSWLFRYYKSIHELKEEFFREGFMPDEAWRTPATPSPLTRLLFRSRIPAALIFIVLSGTGTRRRPAVI